MQIAVNLSFSKKTMLISSAVLLGTAAIAFYIVEGPKSPLPADIKSQLAYAAIYPVKTEQIQPSSYDYQAGSKTLTFIVNKSGNNIVFTEQPSPESLGIGDQVYFQSIGIHPYAQFKTKLGPVALTRFWESGTLKPTGQSAVLVSKGTILIAHSEKNLTNAQWKDLLDSLKITK